MTEKRYSPISVRVEVAEDFRRLAKGLDMENTETLQVCLAAYDIINNTRYGGPFRDAVDKAFTEVMKS